MMSLDERIDLAKSMLGAKGECFIEAPEVFEDGIVNFTVATAIAARILDGKDRSWFCIHFKDHTILMRRDRWWHFAHHRKYHR